MWPKNGPAGSESDRNRLTDVYSDSPQFIQSSFISNHLRSVWFRFLTYDAARLHSVLIDLHQIVCQVTELRLHALITDKQEILNRILQTKTGCQCCARCLFNVIWADNLSLFYLNICPRNQYASDVVQDLSPILLKPKAISLAETAVYNLFFTR